MKTPEFSNLSRYVLCLLCGGALTSVSAYANTDAHVHSVAKLSIVQDGAELLMELNSPLANLTGFEYQPRNMEEKSQLNRAIIKLRDAKRQFEFSGWHCDAKEVEVIKPWREKESDHDKSHHSEADHSGHHDDAHHDEDDHHDDDKHHENAHHDDAHHDDAHHESSHHEKEHESSSHHDSEHESHSDLQVHYHFVCSDTDKQQGLKTMLFSDFPLIEEIEVEWLTGNGAGTAELTASKNKIAL